MKNVIAGLPKVIVAVASGYCAAMGMDYVYATIRINDVGVDYNGISIDFA